MRALPLGHVLIGAVKEFGVMNLRTLLIASIAISLSPIASTLAAQKTAPQTAPLRGAKIYGDRERGEVLVGRWCLNCHKAGAAVDDRAPPFATLARDAQKNEGVIRSF